MLLLLLTGCRQDMADQPRYRALEESRFFDDGRAARDLPAGVVPRSAMLVDNAASTYPIPVTIEVLKRGQQRYNIFCTPCHDSLGTGQGMAVKRGFRRMPPSFHIDRLREVESGHFYDVIANGFGAMNDYAAQIPYQDRWAIVAYIRALQLSQAAPIEILPYDLRRELEGGRR
jgi:hypothetical protein